MNLSLVILIAFVLIAVVFVIVKRTSAAYVSDSKALTERNPIAPAYVYYVKEYGKLTLVSKVRLADIFGIKKGMDKGQSQAAFNRISAKHVDFLFCRASDGRPVLGIELDDSSHSTEAGAKRDALVDSIFAAAGLPLLHVPAKSAYDPREIERQIAAALGDESITPGKGEADL